MTGKILGPTGLRLSPFGAALAEGSGAPPMSSFADPPNWCDVPAETAPDAWARLMGLLEAQWSLALSRWVESADEEQASSAVGGEPGGGRGAPLSAPAATSGRDVHHPDFFLQVRVRPDHWDRTLAEVVDQVLWRTGQPQIDLLQLAPFDRERIKAGEPFRRLEELRDAQRIRFFSIGVSSLHDALWVLDQTPVHAIAINTPRHELGWSELFDAANRSDIGLIAGPVAADNDPEVARHVLTDTPVASFSWPVHP